MANAFQYNYKPIDYKTAQGQVSKQLDPLYNRAVAGVNQQKYANDVQAGQVAAARGLGHSGLAADQLNKIAIAAQGQVADLSAQRASQTAQMANDLVWQDKNYSLQNRAQLYGEWNNNRNYNYQVGRDKVGDSQWQKTFDYNKSVDNRNFNYQKGRDSVDDAWRKYQFNNMSAADKAQLAWAKQQYGEDAAWRMYELKYNGNLQKSMSDTEAANFSGASQGGGYNNNYKTQQQSSKSGSFKSFQSHLQQAIQKGVPSSWTTALTELVGRESSWNPNAKNPNSTAHGYGQFLNSTVRNYSKYGNYNNPVDQLVMMAQYVKDRYGTPEKALAFWDRNKWY